MGNDRRLVLVVDDESYRRENNKRILEEVGFTVETAPFGFEASAWIKKQEVGSVYAVVTDLSMEDQQAGYWVARNAKEHDPAIRVVLVSSFLRVEGPFDEKVEKPQGGPEDYKRFHRELQAAVLNNLG